MTTVRIPAPDLEADVSAEQVAAYLLRPGSGWTEAVNLSAHWRTFTMGMCTAHAPRSAMVNYRVAESIHDIARAEGRHPSDVLADIVGPARGASVGAACQSAVDIERSKCMFRARIALRAAERKAREYVYVETADDDSTARRAGEESE